MSDYTWSIQPRDPVLLRDGRPFTNDPGSQARSLEWPLPSTTAGALRTHIGNACQFDWSGTGPSDARSIIVKGPLLWAERGDEGSYYLTSPADAVIYESAEHIKVMRLSPWKIPLNAGTDLPEGLLPLSVNVDCKPVSGYDYWSVDDTVGWLATDTTHIPAKHLKDLEKETRVHVRIDTLSGAASEGGIFVTESLCMPDVSVPARGGAHGIPIIQAVCRVQSSYQCDLQQGSFIPFGGERRVSCLQNHPAGWPAYPELLKKCAGSNRLKLQLVTPGLFSGSWRPGWIGNTAIEQELSNAKLISAAVPRKNAVSGWDYEKNRPKAARYACAAGSVYFLELQKPITEALLKQLWLCSICDDTQDNNDGFGLAIPGTWNYYTEGEK